MSSRAAKVAIVASCVCAWASGWVVTKRAGRHVELFLRGQTPLQYNINVHTCTRNCDGNAAPYWAITKWSSVTVIDTVPLPPTGWRTRALHRAFGIVYPFPPCRLRNDVRKARRKVCLVTHATRRPVSRKDLFRLASRKPFGSMTRIAPQSSAMTL